MRVLPFVLVVVGAALLAAPSPAHAQATLSERYDFERRAHRMELPRGLTEVSGLTLAADGRLWAHADEEAVLYHIDTFRDEVIGRFSLGDPAARGDFEGVAAVGERLFLVTSGGWLYETRAAAHGANAPYRVTDLGLGGACEVEGLAHHPVEEVLLVACKSVAPARDAAVVHRIPLAPDRPRPAPIEVSGVALRAAGLDDGIHPSAVEVDPLTGHVVLLAAREAVLLEVDTDGRVHGLVRLRERWHRQAEGLAFRDDGALLVADEGRGGRGRITVYRPRTR